MSTSKGLILGKWDERVTRETPRGSYKKLLGIGGFDRVQYMETAMK
jgi:hypothetical protein